MKKRRKAKISVTQQTNQAGTVRLTCSCGASLTVTEPVSDVGRAMIGDFEEIHTTCKTYQSQAWEHVQQATRGVADMRHALGIIMENQSKLSALHDAIVATMAKRKTRKARR